MTAIPRRKGAVEPESVVSGSVDPGFEQVRQEFIRSFAERGELGAACAVYHRGRKVIGLWGGYCNTAGEPWEEDTLVLVFSATKGLSAMAMAVAHSQGLLQYDETVASYWPNLPRTGSRTSRCASCCAIRPDCR